MDKQEKTKKLLSPKNDVVFQALFGTKGSEKILSGLLSKILEEKVENVELNTNQNLTPENPNQKLGILDLRANIGDSTEVDIEMQLTDKGNTEERILYYWARMYGEKFIPGEDYKNAKRTIAILLVDYNIKALSKFKDAHTEWKLREERKPEIIIFNKMEIHIIEMPKIKKYGNETEKGLSNWIEFLLNPESEETKMSMSEDEKLKAAYEKLIEISEDEGLRRRAESIYLRELDDRNMKRYAREQGLEEGRKEGMKEGMKKGMKEGAQKGREELKLEIAKKLVEMNMTTEQIQVITEMEKEEIEKLKKKK